MYFPPMTGPAPEALAASAWAWMASTEKAFCGFRTEARSMEINGRYSWKLVDINGYSWIFMDINGYSWILMDINGY